MRVDTWRLYPVFALALLAGGSIWLERITRIEDPVTSLEQTGPDFIAHDTRVTGFGADGAQRYELVAERLEHFPAGDIMTRGAGRASARGMRADNLFGTLELIGEVSTTMPPRRQGSSS
jgi:lipopolysaccharide export system protein LptC